ncbi:unnamed protein product, partial [Notodromas monacha]
GTGETKLLRHQDMMQDQQQQQQRENLFTTPKMLLQTASATRAAAAVEYPCWSSMSESPGSPTNKTKDTPSLINFDYVDDEDDDDEMFRRFARELSPESAAPNSMGNAWASGAGHPRTGPCARSVSGNHGAANTGAAGSAAGRPDDDDPLLKGIGTWEDFTNELQHRNSERYLGGDDSCDLSANLENLKIGQEHSTPNAHMWNRYDFQESVDNDDSAEGGTQNTRMSVIKEQYAWSDQDRTDKYSATRAPSNRKGTGVAFTAAIWDENVEAVIENGGILCTSEDLDTSNRSFLSPIQQVNAATQKKSASNCTQNFAGNESSSNAVMSLQINASNDSQNTSKLIPLQSNGFFEANATNSSMITNDPSENSLHLARKKISYSNPVVFQSANQKSRCSANTGKILCGSNKSTNKEPEICGSKDLDRVRILAAILQEEKRVCSFMQQDVAELEEMVKICTFQQLLKIRIRFAKQNVKKLRQQPPLTYFSEDTTVMNKYRKALNEFAKAAIEREICDTGRPDGFKRPAKGCHTVDNVLEDEEEMEEEQLKPGKALLRVAYRLKTDVETTAPQNLKILLIQIARLESKIPCITESRFHMWAFGVECSWPILRFSKLALRSQLSSPPKYLSEFRCCSSLVKSSHVPMPFKRGSSSSPKFSGDLKCSGPKSSLIRPDVRYFVTH